MEHLLPAFVAATARAGATAPATELEGAGMDVLRRWSEPARSYHDVEHLTEVLQHLEDIGCTHPTVLLAAWFHDAVYRGRPGEDEQASAVLARTELVALGAPDATAAEVSRLVLSTATHEPRPGDERAAALCDADLAILASDPQRYRRYVTGVRREYDHLGGEAFAAGRAAVLRRLLERASIFTTATGRSRWEASARANLTAELAHLGG